MSDLNLDQKELKEFYKIFGIKEIPDNRNYWLIRTSAGSFFNDFYKNNYVAIGWDEFSDVNQIKNVDEDKMKAKISNIYKDEKRPGYIYNQIKRFMFDIKIGDMILIPSENSSNIAFGIVTQNIYVRNNVNNLKLNKNICTFKKCIGVNWFKIISKNKFDPYLRMLMFSHSTISDVNCYKDYINRLLFPLYVSDNQIHLTYKVQSEDDISFSGFSKFLNIITNSLEVFDDITKNNFSTSKLDIKTTLNSPGVIEIIGYCFAGGLALTCINSFLFGGKFEVNLLKLGNFSAEHSGIFGTILKFKQEANKTDTELTKLKKEYAIQKEMLKLKAPNENSSEK